MIKEDFTRVGTIIVPKHVVLQSLVAYPKGLFGKTSIKHLKEGYVVRDVNYDFMNQSFIFLIYHPLFEAIPEGVKIPEAHPDFVFERQYYDIIPYVSGAPLRSE